MKNSIKQPGDQFGEIPPKEMDRGRENITKKISLRDLTPNQQEFQNKGTEKLVGRKLSKK